MTNELNQPNDIEPLNENEQQQLNLTTSDTVEIDHLTEDEPIPGQGFVCISFLSPEGIKNTTLRGVKVRGVFPTYEAATKHAAKLQKIDPLFNIFVGEVGKWLPWDPSPSTIEDNQYREKELQELMVKHKEEMEKGKVAESERKTKMLADSVATASKNNKKMTKREQLKQTIEDRKNDKTIKESLSTAKPTSKPGATLETKKEQINNTEKEIASSTTNLENVSNNIKEIEKLYNQLKQKKAQSQQSPAASQ
jgi:hypothetical protein